LSYHEEKQKHVGSFVVVDVQMQNCNFVGKKNLGHSNYYLELVRLTLDMVDLKEKKVKLTINII